ncbi:6-deoxyerythronolide-B synthase EryA2, modules 3 and 4 [Folsomia candida]|uniref:6-deoxyerythronolide-B synthase EryA2, modules 3 and 4 n=1 Tax=Folsomia candida TaxID=158441 RepID=UPI000B904D39|nr:6-deoxyerythronolide-B synthase EryA2, modules 3 and 4 [Folsomia candida]
MGKEAYATFARNPGEVEDAIIFLKSIKETKTFKKVLILYDPRIGLSSWTRLVNLFDDVVQVTSFPELKMDFWSQLLLTCSTLLDFDRVCLIDPAALVLKNCDSLFSFNPTQIVFGSGLFILRPGADASGYVLDCLKNGLESEFTFHNLKERLINGLVGVYLEKQSLMDLRKGEFELVPSTKIVFLDESVNQVTEIAKELLGFREKLKEMTYSKFQTENEPIAIVGMSCRIPNSMGVEEYWKTFLDAKCVIRPPPDGRWTFEKIGTNEEGQMECGFLPYPVDEFDGDFFEISPAECNFTDPQQRFQLEASSTRGCRHKPTISRWKRDRYAAGFARLAHTYKVRGPNLGADVACSSSFVAIGQAVHDLQRGVANLAITTAANLIIKPTFQNDVILSKDFRCKTFDSSANGFARAEGVAALILKRLSDAERDGDRIHSVIMGYGATQEGETKSVGTPTVEMEALAMELALRDAALKPEHIQVVEAHGTGTAKGDPLEIKAIAKAYSTSNRDDPLIITAGKANIGHTESASGIAGLIKITMAMKNGLIPRQTGIHRLNPKINLSIIPAAIPLEGNIPWRPVPVTPKIAGISSFGFTGTNTHIILQEAPKSNYNAFGPMRLDDIAYTANVGRAKFSNRIAVTAKNNKELSQKLNTKNWSSWIVQNEPKICFLFPGQGTQHLGMGSQLYDKFPVFKEHFDKCSQLMNQMYGLDIKTAFWGDCSSKRHQSLFATCSVFVIEYCLIKLYESLGVYPDLTAASLITLDDALKIVGSRFKLLDKLPEGKMVAANAQNDSCLELIAKFLKSRSAKDIDWLDIAARNSEEQTIVSGPPLAIEEFAEFCRNHGVRVRILDTSYPFHSRGLDPIITEYKEVLNTLGQQAVSSACKFISSVDGTDRSNLSPEYWKCNARDSVQFIKAVQTIEKLIQEDDSGRQYIFLEMGPHPVLSALVHSNFSFTPQCIKSMKKGCNEMEVFLQALGKLFVHGVQVHFDNFHDVHYKTKVSLPFYPFQRKSFWFPFESVDGSSCSNKDIVHPLLGRQVALPGSGPLKAKRFEHLIAATSNHWIGDHRIGQWLLMPAAGFIEMSLGAHCLMSDRILNHFTIENFSIQTPAYLTQTGSTYHTILEGNLIKIYSRFDTDTWTLHSVGTVKESSRKDLNCTANSIAQLQDHQSPLEISAEAMYERLINKGYNYGESFRCIKSLWEDQMSNQYARIKLDPGHIEWSKDPIAARIIDQTTTSSGDETKSSWLIFGLHDSFTKDLMCKLKESGEIATLITDGPENRMSTQCIQTMGSSKEEFVQILSKFPEIRGAIFSWGFRSVLDDVIIEKWLYLLQAIAAYSGRFDKLLLLTQGCPSNNAELFAQKPVAALLVGMFRSFQSENPIIACKIIGLDAQNHGDIQNIIEETYQDPNATSGGNMICYREGVRLTQNLVKLKPPTLLKLPKTSRFSLRLPTSNIISDLKFMVMPPVALKKKELEIKVNAYSLNFRDIFAVLKPTEAFAKLNVIGSDFSGVISRIGSPVNKYQVGDMVFGCHNQNVALPSHIITTENIKKSDTVLIHAALGGVGLAAVQLANTVGANVIATAGSLRKRAYLTNIVGIKHVFNSRNLSFEAAVSAATDGAGVDIVLNSLTGRGFKEASLNCLKKGGRLIEMSKINVWTEEECMSLRPDVKYSIEDLSLSEDNSALSSQLENIATGLWQPLPYVHFQSQEIRDAHSFLEKAKHIGKVVVSMPDKENKLFNHQSNYLITGGCGGIGWELMKWMLENGAKQIFLMGRRIPSLERQSEINYLNDRGFHVTWKRGDVNKLAECESVFYWIKEEFPQSPLRGIFHCAGVLSDAVILNQTKETLEKVLSPKFHGGWDLHELSKTLNLQYFVLFSSISSLIGTIGQGNYSAANSFLDALSHYRHAQGLPAICLNFGQWGEVGLAAGQNISGLHPMSTKQALALELALKSKYIQLCPSSINVTKLVQRIPWIENFLANIQNSEKKHNSKIFGPNKFDIVSSEKFYVEFDSCENEVDRNSVILKYLRTIVCSVLQLEQNDWINRKFSQLGLDSLMMIEIKNKTSGLLGGNVQMGINDFTDSEDLESLVKQIKPIKKVISA